MHNPLMNSEFLLYWRGKGKGRINIFFCLWRNIYFTNRLSNYIIILYLQFVTKQGRKRPLDTPKRMIERREREGERERKREGWQARRVNPTLRLMLSPNYRTRACKKGRGTRAYKKKGGGRAQFPLWKENPRKLSSENYQWELLSQNYDLVYHHAEKLRLIGILAYPKILVHLNKAIKYYK